MTLNPWRLKSAFKICSYINTNSIFSAYLLNLKLQNACKQGKIQTSSFILIEYKTTLTIMFEFTDLCESERIENNFL